MNNYKKYLVIGILVLFIGTNIGAGFCSNLNDSLDITNGLKVNNIDKKSHTDRAWSDNFDSYETGQFLDGDPEDGGWVGWDDTPSAGAYVVDDPYQSNPHSVEIAGNSDLVQPFFGYTSGKWRFIAWQFIPEDFTGLSYFILLSDYADVDPGTNSKWAIQIKFDGSGIVESEFDSVTLPLIKGEWVLLRTEIDLDADWFEFYYNEDLLVEKAWTSTPQNTNDGFLVIDAVDLFGNGASPVYYDDLSLDEAQPLLCDANGPYEGIIEEDIEMDGTAMGGIPPYEYYWDFGDGYNSDDMHPTHNYEEPGVYTVTLTVTDFTQETAFDETTATIIGIPELDVGAIEGGKGISAIIKNNGNGDATDVTYNIEIIGGLFINPSSDSGNYNTLGPQESKEITLSPFGIGLGIFTDMPKITITVDSAEGSSDTSSKEARIILNYVFIQ